MVAVATVNKNTLYPELQREFDEDPLNFRGNIRARAAAGRADMCTCRGVRTSTGVSEHWRFGLFLHGQQCNFHLQSTSE